MTVNPVQASEPNVRLGAPCEQSEQFVVRPHPYRFDPFGTDLTTDFTALGNVHSHGVSLPGWAPQPAIIKIRF